jgi:hypothetical protein
VVGRLLVGRWVTVQWVGRSVARSDGRWLGSVGEGCAVPDHVDAMSRIIRETQMNGYSDGARYVIDAVVLEGRGVREGARSHGVSKSWVSTQLACYRRAEMRPSSLGHGGPVQDHRWSEHTSGSGPTTWTRAGT